MQLDPRILLAAATVFVAFSFALLGVILWISSLLGWKRWHACHPCDRAMIRPGTRSSYLFRTGGFGWWACYNRCLRVIRVEGGLAVRPIPPFLWFHPWIFLPFDALSDAVECEGIFKHRRLVFRGPGRLKFTLRLPPGAPEPENKKHNE